MDNCSCLISASNAASFLFLLHLQFVHCPSPAAISLGFISLLPPFSSTLTSEPTSKLRRLLTLPSSYSDRIWSTGRQKLGQYCRIQAEAGTWFKLCLDSRGTLGSTVYYPQENRIDNVVENSGFDPGYLYQSSTVCFIVTNKHDTEADSSVGQGGVFVCVLKEETR